jgi:hypothetical protein
LDRDHSRFLGDAEMTRCLRTLPLFLLAGSLMAGPVVRQYRVQLAAKADGAGQATVSLDLERCVPGSLVIPVGLALPANLGIETLPTGARLESGPGRVRLQLPEGVAPACQVVFSFPVAQVFQPAPRAENGEKPIPAASLMLKHTFINTMEETVGDYAFEFRLPEGYLVQGVREQLPKLGKAETGPRVRLDKADGRQGGVLRVARVPQGGTAAVLLEAIPERKSPMWLLVGVVLGGLYLFFFRDLVARKTA